MSTSVWVVLAWLLLTLYSLIGVTFRFCCCLMTGEDPIDAIRPRRAMVRDALLWPLIAFFIVAIVVAEGLSIGGVALEFVENARIRSRLVAHRNDDRGAA